MNRIDARSFISVLFSAVGGAIVPGFHPPEAGAQPSVVPGGEIDAAGLLRELVVDQGAGPGPPHAGEFFDAAGVLGCELPN
jgi:hypothetical protein